MSEVAGRMATQVGATYLEKPHGGRGVLMGGVPGVAPANVAILGGGTVGANAAQDRRGHGRAGDGLDVNHDRLHLPGRHLPRPPADAARATNTTSRRSSSRPTS